MIFYFTATGNCLYAAQELQRELGGPLHAIQDLMRQDRYDFTTEPNEYVGFVFPVYFWGLPDILPQFLSRLRVQGTTPERTFILATMGGTAGNGCELLERTLADRGIRAGYKFAVKMADNYIPMFTMPGPAEVQRQLAAAEAELRRIAGIIRDGKPASPHQRLGPLFALLAPPFHLLYPRSTRRFYADIACTGCGLCQRICPVEAIRLEGGAPKWVKSRCETCLACLHRCPAQAIQYGKDLRKKGRYVNPRAIWSGDASAAQ